MALSLKRLHSLALWTSIIGIFVFIYDFGFSQSDLSQEIIDGYYFIVLAIGLASTFVRYALNSSLFKRKVFVFDLLSVLFTGYVYFLYLFIGQPFKTDLVLENPVWLAVAVILSFVREFSEIKVNYNRAVLNPAQLFIVSFLVLIFLGTFLLMLPRATHEGLSFIDAWFTATSAVCVTGLAVVDTGTYFTLFGQTILLFLIQIGGIGILTFASYFSYFFKGGTSYENHLTLSEIGNSNKLSDVFKTLKSILVITVTIELIAAVSIFLSLQNTQITNVADQLFFSVFHAVSAFCNAGFSTLSNSAYDIGFRYNYMFQLVLIGTLIFGGLGFPIMTNILSYLKDKLKHLLWYKKYEKTYRPWVLKINSRITLVTTVSLTAVAFIAFFILEYHNTLAEHSFFGKIVTALFEAATPRTAGFNSVDMNQLTFPAIMLTFLLMWIGASPASTGGGIKTSTFAIAVLNITSLARGKSRIEVYRREISDVSVKRAFATIALSLLVIGFGIMFITIFNPEKGLLKIAFECFSAYSTVGISLGITSSLSTASKLVIITIMFIGRVSMLSVIVALFKKVKQKNYKYPTEEITIN
ncbi:TrkH family potassium uptake protein [Bizionia sp. KMM 8389]